MPPNFVFIISDNQSPWTLGCYGNEDILTPNVDRLAREGVRFGNSFCVNPVCSPNRATLLTGLVPSQHGVHNYLATEEPDAQMGPDAYSTIGEFVTLPRLLADAGYRCGMSGKWHLGDSLHPQLGFTYWFAKPRGHTASFYDAEAIWEGEVYTEPRYYLDAIADHAVDFLRGTGDEPFFLYLGFNGPYGLDHDMRVGHRNRHTEYYEDKKLACFPREDPHPWLRQNRDCINNQTAMRSYAAAVTGVDDGVGQVMHALEELGVSDDTLVVFTADHGLCAGHHGFWGMADHGRPLTMYDENLRVPLVLRHPDRIPAGTVCETTVCNYDFLPSVLEYLELANHPLAEPTRPGRSYAPALAGEPLEWDDETTFHEYENARTIRTRRWKYTHRFPDGPDDLYDLQEDPSERENLAGDPEHAESQRELRGRLDAFFARYADPQYDLWRGGTSKAGRAIPGLADTEPTG
jgi:arylsulfatase A-like enzyme